MPYPGQVLPPTRWWSPIEPSQELFELLRWIQNNTESAEVNAWVSAKLYLIKNQSLKKLVQMLVSGFFQPYYYAIKGKRKDGFTYVLYVNGGHPPWSLLDYMSHCCGIVCSTLNPWYLARFALRKLNLAWFNALPRFRQIAQSSTAAVFSWKLTSCRRRLETWNPELDSKLKFLSYKLSWYGKTNQAIPR